MSFSVEMHEGCRDELRAGRRIAAEQRYSQVQVPIILTRHNLVLAFPLHRVEVHAFGVDLDARTSPEVLAPQRVTMASRTASDTSTHAGGSPTVRVASTRMLHPAI